MPAPESVRATSDAGAKLVEEVAAELHREDEEVLVPLTKRVDEVAELLAERKPVDPDYLLSAIHLWGRFVHEMHEQRVARLFLLFPPSEPLAVHSHRTVDRLRARLTRRRPEGTAEDAPSDAATQVLNDIREDQRRMVERIAALESLVGGYRNHVFYSRELLSSLLRSAAFADRTWAKFEEKFVLSHLHAHLGVGVDSRLRDGNVAADAVRNQVEGEVLDFLRRPIALEPAAT